MASAYPRLFVRRLPNLLETGQELLELVSEIVKVVLAHPGSWDDLLGGVGASSC